VGVNVALDPIMSSAYTGVNGGLVLVSADDPGMWSSQNEQDNRWIGLHARLLIFEPYNPQSAMDYTKLAFEFSERFKHPVMVRTVTRVSHTWGIVETCAPSRPKFGSGFFREPRRYALVPANARERKRDLVKRWEEIKRAVEELPHGQWGEGEVLIITTGVGYAYVVEALGNLGQRARVLQIVTPVPLPRRLILDAATAAEKILVVEEGDGVVEMQIRALLQESGLRTVVYGKEYLAEWGELTLEIVEGALAKVLGVPRQCVEPIKPSLEAPPRPPFFCAGCPHMGSFYAAKLATSLSRVKPVYSGDIGCYSMAVSPPYGQQDLLTDMGSSIGLGMGIYRGANGREFIVAVIGDSTFFHAGLPALANAVYTNTPMLVLVLDNRYTAMTGGQPNPTQSIDIAEVSKALGADFVTVADPFDLEKAKEEVRRAMGVVKEGGVAVVVMQRACTLEALRELGLSGPPFYVDLSACRACGLCYNVVACPALMPLPDGKVVIEEEKCVGCSLCAQACPYNAIKPRGDHAAWLAKWATI